MTTVEHRRKFLKKSRFRKQNGSDHEFWILEAVDGTAQVVTKVSFGRKEIPTPVLQKIITRDLYLKGSEYTSIASCRKPKEYYYGLVAERYER